MKIAVATNDGCTIARDLGRAAYYAVLTVEGGLIVGRELREKQPRGWYRATGHAEHHGPASSVPETVQGHNMLVDPIDDCAALLASGIDPVSREQLEEAGIWPVEVEPGPIEPAVRALMAGALVG